jgi:hypothetical protein
MDLHFYRLGKIQTENSHNGFCIHDIPAGCQVNIEIIFVDDIDKILDIVYRFEKDVESFQWLIAPPFRVIVHST